MDINSNQIYLLVSIIIFIFLYYKIPTSQYDISNDSSEILIELNSIIIKADSKNIYTHMQLIKENLRTLNNMEFPYDLNTSNKIEMLVNAARSDLNLFKKSCHYKDSLLIETVDTSTGRSDIEQINSKVDLSGLMYDVEIITMLLKNNNSILILTNLHDLLKLFASIMPNDSHMTYTDIFNIDDIGESFAESSEKLNNYARAIPKLNSFSHNNTHGYGNEETDGEIFLNDTENTRVSVQCTKRKHHIADAFNIYNTQLFGASDAMSTTVKNGIKNYIPFCDIDKLRKEYNLIKVNAGVDRSGRSGLRNDYNL